MWKYQIGGYQVCEKWLKDRKELHLELDDIRTYCRIVTALGRTIELQSEMDALYPEVERDTIPIPPSPTPFERAGQETRTLEKSSEQ